MNITLDSISLMTSPYRVKKMTVEDVENREISVMGLARQRGGLLLNAELKPKKFTLIGAITGTDQADLDDNIDTFKELITRRSKDLDMTYGSGTRRYIVTASKINIPREHYHIDYCPFEVEFIAPAGVGYDTTETTETQTGITDLTKNDAITIAGSAPPDVKLTLTFTAENAITSLDFLANGNKITLTAAFTSTDVVVFDAENMKVTLNGTEVAYTGIFPEFFIGSNDYLIEAHGTSCTYNYTLAYTKTYA